MKIEQRFNVGDWVKEKNGLYFGKITSVKDNYWRSKKVYSGDFVYFAKIDYEYRGMVDEENLLPFEPKDNHILKFFDIITVKEIEGKK